MNKYQEALDYIKSLDIDSESDGYNSPKLLVHFYPEIIETLQQLTDTTKPLELEELEEGKSFFHKSIGQMFRITNIEKDIKRIWVHPGMYLIYKKDDFYPLPVYMEDKQ